MRFRRLLLRVQTSDGLYTATLDFPDGLVVIWADNSMGKSTCVRSILVALGLEAMLTTSRSELPLPPAMRTRLESDRGNHEVIESEVFLEIENHNGARVVLQRTIKGTRDKDLITVHDGPALSQPGAAAQSHDYFVNQQGGASRPAGFHYWLATFLGWSIPMVPSFEGSDKPLYLQYIFPYFVVEQTRGWSTVSPPLPTQFRIRDAHKRVVEFLLNLDAHRVALRRQELVLEKASIEADWRAAVASVNESGALAAGTVQALPRTPTGTWPPLIPPALVIPRGEAWITLPARINERQSLLADLVESEIPRVQDVVATTQAELNRVERDTREKQALLARLLDQLEMEQDEVRHVQHRITAIEEDIKRHKDVQTLRRLGSRQNSQVDAGQCPICHQSIQDSLLPISADLEVMSLESNIDFLSEQRQTFQLVIANAKRIADARSAQVAALNDEVNQQRDMIRELKQTLTSDGRLPSAAAIRERIVLENSIRHDQAHLAQFNSPVERFAPLSRRWTTWEDDYRRLPTEDTTHDDKAKIGSWSRIVREELAQFGFRSFSPTEVVISPDSYRPEHQGFELQATHEVPTETTMQLQNSISASDLIRTIWAYFTGLLELARTQATNHPGCVIFDEPRQQSAKDVSFAELLRRASNAGAFGQQVIFFTSENLERLRGHLQTVPHTLLSYDGRMLKRAIEQN